MLGMFKPSSMMVRQLLMASGVNDPEVLGVVEKAMNGAMSSPTITHMTGSEGVCIPVPENCKCVRLAMDSPDGKTEVFMLVHPKVVNASG